MNELTDNPFDNPFDQPVPPARTPAPSAGPDAGAAGIGEYNPFVNGNTATSASPALIQPTPPPAYSAVDIGVPPPAVTKPPIAPGTEELLRRQMELDQKAEELRKRESTN